MLLSVVLLAVIVGAVVGLTRGCEFSPTGPSVDPSAVPSVDATKELRSAGGRVTFAIRVPALPGDWRSNSFNTIPVGQGAQATTAVRVGWITPDGKYLRLSQSDAAVDLLVPLEAGSEASADSRGSVDVAGTKWTKYPGKGTEQSWVTTLDGVQLLITGSGTEDDFRTLATAAQTAKPVERG